MVAFCIAIILKGQLCGNIQGSLSKKGYCFYWLTNHICLVKVEQKQTLTCMSACLVLPELRIRKVIYWGQHLQLNQMYKL